MSLHYVPAGIEVYSAKAQLTAKMEHNAEESTTFGRKFKEWRLRDRTIRMTMTTTRESMNITSTADVAVPIFGPEFVRMCGLTKVLVNPIHKPVHSLPFKKRNIKSIVDSGGFQLLVGTVPFVEPQSVVDNYNANADIGMPLDLPVRAAAESEFFDPVSYMIRANDKWILERLNPGVDLALISHGTNIELRRRRLDVLDRDANVVAIAGLNIKPPPGVDHLYNNVENLMYVLQRYRKRTTYFHVLGVTAKLWIFFYALIDAYGYVKEIGADSVSHRLGALAGLYNHLDFTQEQLSKVHKHRDRLSCACPVCAIVQDKRIIGNATTLEAHNLWVVAKQTEQLQDLARAYLAGTEDIKLIFSILNVKGLTLEKFTHMVNYVMDVMAKDKWRPIKADNRHKSLFHSMKAERKDPALLDRYKTILEKYEAFHKQKFIGRKVK